VALVRSSSKLKGLKGDTDGENIGIEIVRRSCRSPLSQIVRNAGEEPAIILQKVEKQTGTKGYNAATGKYVDMMEDGIIDPVKVTRCALENAASVAGLMLTVETSIVEEDQDQLI